MPFGSLQWVHPYGERDKDTRVTGYFPWKVVTYLYFQGDQRAVEFERYLKTGSGQAFANKRLLVGSGGINLARLPYRVERAKAS
jgi:hypothetical protein